MIFFLEYLQVNGYPLIYVLWNVFLALIPVYISYYLYKKFSKQKFKSISRKNKILLTGLFIVWIFFFPNTSYLFTEVRYLVDYCFVVTDLKICADKTFIPPFFLFYSLIGIPTFIYSLKVMSNLLSKLFNKKLAILFPVVMIPASAIGILLGLVERFNSWDIIIHPLVIIRTGLGYLLYPNKLLGVIAYTILLYIVYYGFLRFIKIFNNKKQ